MIRIGHTWDGEPVAEADVAWVGVRLDDDALRLTVDAPFHDDPQPPGPPGPTAGLWSYEVVELFLVGSKQRYTEIEVGPYGHHLVLRLDGVRQQVASELPMELSVSREGSRWRAEGVVARSLLPARIESFNAYRIHGVGAERRYLAHRAVPGPAPDFHRLARFAAWPP